MLKYNRYNPIFRVNYQSEYKFETQSSKYQEHQNHSDNYLLEIGMKLQYSRNEMNFMNIRNCNNQFKELNIIILNVE